jgi:hypothetical protein
MSTDYTAEMAAAWLKDRATDQLRLKRRSFAIDYEVGNKPALVLQLMPVGARVTVDLRAAPVGKALRREGLQPQVAWWREFASSEGIRPVFDGIAANGKSSSNGWTTELHTDGHLISGLWKFPDDGDQGVAVRGFFEKVFADFASLASGVYEAAAISGQMSATCTLLNATKLPLTSRNGWGDSAPAPRREVLEWPVEDIAAVDGIAAAFEVMRARFARAYGLFEFEID